MASTIKIDGSISSSASADIATVFSGGWAVDYDWLNDRAVTSGQPRRLSTILFPAPFDSNLEGALRGRAGFVDFLYLFKNGQYLRMRASTMTPDGPAATTPGPWDLPATWTSIDAVLPGSGAKINFAYFFHDAEYVRYDWTTDRRSPGYPKTIATEWHTTAPFVRQFDGVIIGQSGFSTKAYLFHAVGATVNDDGNPVAAGTAGSHLVSAPAYIRYDFNNENTEGAELNPALVVANWSGLFPLLDAGPAVDLAVSWCNAATLALANPAAPPVAAALAHHFMTSTPSPAQITAIIARMTAVRDRLLSIPDRFKWTVGLSFAAQTVPQISTEIGDLFSNGHGPNGRAAVMIHEAVHFTHLGGPAVDVPESGEVVNGVAFGIDTLSGIAYHTITTDQAITNPSSYASFAQEIALGADTRFGAARPQQ